MHHKTVHVLYMYADTIRFACNTQFMHCSPLLLLVDALLSVESLESVLPLVDDNVVPD